VVAHCDHLSRLKFAKALPRAFTEHGTIMAASVLHSRRAVEVAAFVVRAFVKVRRVLSDDRELAHKSASRLESFDVSKDRCLPGQLPFRRKCLSSRGWSDGIEFLVRAPRSTRRQQMTPSGQPRDSGQRLPAVLPGRACLERPEGYCASTPVRVPLAADAEHSHNAADRRLRDPGPATVRRLSQQLALATY